MVDRPPIPRLALTIGVAGHRPHRPPQPGEAPDPPFDAEKVRAAIDGVLDRLKRAVEEVAREDGGQFEGAPVVALVTSLAEGADRIAAEAARDAELPFDVVLPFAREDYLATFESEESRAEFDALAEKARATLILPRVADENPDEAAGRSYAQAAATVLAQSDLLLAVWDGAPARGKGGTAETVDEAARQATPIVVIDPLGGILSALVGRSGVAAARPARERAADRARPRRRSSRRRSSTSPSPREQDRAAGPASFRQGLSHSFRPQNDRCPGLLRC